MEMLIEIRRRHLHPPNCRTKTIAAVAATDEVRDRLKRRTFKFPIVVFPLAFIFFLFSQFGKCSSSAEFTYGYDTDEYTLAFLNATYVDPGTGQSRSSKEEAGKFSVGRVEAVSGLLVRASSANHTRHDACQALDSDLIPQGEPWIALIEYGNCGESTKLRNAANSNASAAIVYNDKQGQRLIKMHHRVFQIVSVFITKEKGEELISVMENGTRVILHVTVGGHNSFRYANINRTSVLFVSISFIILMVISLAWLVFYYVQRFRYIHAKDLLARRLCSAAKKALDKIPVKSIRSGDREADNDFECCAVCIEPFKIAEVVRTLPCKHTFHKCCVDPWLLEQRSCPMCKMDILKYYGLIFSGSQESVLNIEEHDLRPHGRAEVEVLHHQSALSSSPLDLDLPGLLSSSSSSAAYPSSTSHSTSTPFNPPPPNSPLPFSSPRPTCTDIAVIEGNLISPLCQSSSPPLIENWNRAKLEPTLGQSLLTGFDPTLSPRLTQFDPALSPRLTQFDPAVVASPIKLINSRLAATLDPTVSPTSRMSHFDPALTGLSSPNSRMTLRGNSGLNIGFDPARSPRLSFDSASSIPIGSASFRNDDPEQFQHI